MRNKKIVYLYTEVMPYQTIIYDELSTLGYEVHVFFQDKLKQTPYVPPIKERVYYYQESNYDKRDLVKKVCSINPSLLVVCGWSSVKYMYLAKYFKKHMNIQIVCPIDTQFLNRLKQCLGILLSPFYIKNAFTHLWVPGARQYEFARLLGFPRKSIIFNSLSADINLFSQSCIVHKQTEYPKRFLYVGRFVKAKGLQSLIDAWNSIEDKNGWKLTLIGNGPLKNLLRKYKDVEVFDFLSQKELTSIAAESGCFILPSIYEPWALVLHEFAAAGLPLLCSDACGASDVFVISGYNGYVFKTGFVSDLSNKILKIINTTPEVLYAMSCNSRKLSTRISPEVSVASLLSVLE